MSVMLKTDLFSRGRALAMGVVAALAFTAIAVLPAGAAWAEEDRDPDAATVQETTEEAAAAEDPAAEVAEGADLEGPADAVLVDEALRARAPGAAPAEGGPVAQQAPAPTAEAPTVDRKISGTVKFAADTTLAQKRAFAVYVSKPGQQGTRYKAGVSGFSYNPTSAGAGTLNWTISGLERAKYYIWIDIYDAGGYYSAPLALGLNGGNAPIDLASGNATGVDIDAGIGSLSVGMVSPYTAAGTYKLMLVDASGNAKNVTNSVFSGDSSASYPLRNHDFNAKPGTYTLRADLPNGLKIYYDGTPFGTEQAGKAKTFKIELMKRVKLGNFDLRDFTDVPKGHKFYTDINWLAQNGVTTGVNQPNGTLRFGVIGRNVWMETRSSPVITR